MKSITAKFLFLAIVLAIIASCSKKKQDEKLEAKWKPLADSLGNHYLTGTVAFDANGISVSASSSDAVYKQAIMLEDLKTGANANGSPVMSNGTGSGSGSGTGSGSYLSIGCYKNMPVNCDTLGAVYSPSAVFGYSIDNLIAKNTANGDADGDGFNDASEATALIAAGYNPNEYSLTPLYDPAKGITGEFVSDTLLTNGTQGKNTNSNITYGIDAKGDTVYTPGVGINPITGQPKKVVPDLSKINLNTITAVQGPQGTCMKGWHIPTDGEFKKLELALGMSIVDVDKEGIENDRGRKELLGPKLAQYLDIKYSGYWSDTTKTFAQVGEVEVFWTATAGKENGNDYTWIRYIDTLAHKGIVRKKQFGNNAFSVRCFQNN